MRDLGRIDWRTRLNAWSVVWYVGANGERELGRFPTRQEAIACLRGKLEQKQEPPQGTAPRSTAEAIEGSQA